MEAKTAKIKPGKKPSVPPSVASTVSIVPIGVPLVHVVLVDFLHYDDVSKVNVPVRAESMDE